MLNITHYYRNVNQIYNEISPHTGQNGPHQKIYTQYMLERVWRKGKPIAQLLEMYIDTATIEDGMKIP